MAKLANLALILSLISVSGCSPNLSHRTYDFGREKVSFEREARYRTNPLKYVEVERKTGIKIVYAYNARDSSLYSVSIRKDGREETFTSGPVFERGEQQLKEYFSEKEEKDVELIKEKGFFERIGDWF